MIKTENLTIIFVDIAGFTATTSRQSRVENARLLQTFGSTLLPLIKSFKGRLIKTIGDALLITFRSPTDAMLCSMALQDAMHAYNLSAPDQEKIHIRVAANLGEVRVTKNDIFGEPVNVASRIEGVAPADEIYLSEAVYMAMNKAEVPAQEVGFKELAGVSQAVRFYNIPRFSTHRLVPENAGSEEQGSELLYPYGGMHYQVPSRGISNLLHLSDNKKLSGLSATLLAVFIIAVALLVVYQFINKKTSEEPAAGQTAKSEISKAAPETPNIQRQSISGSLISSPETSDKTTGKSETTVVKKGLTSPKTTDQALVKEVSSTPAKDIDTVTNETISSKAGTGNVSQAITGTKTQAQALLKDDSSAPVEAPVTMAKKTEPVWNVIKAKKAYRAHEISKVEYNQIIRKLKTDYEKKIRQLKLDLKNGKITRAEYDIEVRKAKLAYSGE